MFFLFLAPFLYALCNIYDKYVLVTRARNASSYAILNGVGNFSVSALVLFALGVPDVPSKILLVFVLGAITIAVDNFLYNLSIKEQSASEVVGYVFIFPLFVAILAWIFLDERLALVGYVGSTLLVAGALLLSRVSAIRRANRIVLYIALIIILTSISEVFLKVGADKSPSFSSVALVNLVTGFVTSLLLLHSGIRVGVKEEMSLAPWSLGSSILYFGAVAALLKAMSFYPITIVTALGTLQPLFVLVGEGILYRVRPDVYGPKPGPVKAAALLLISLGAALLLASH